MEKGLQMMSKRHPAGNASKMTGFAKCRQSWTRIALPRFPGQEGSALSGARGAHLSLSVFRQPWHLAET